MIVLALEGALGVFSTAVFEPGKSELAQSIGAGVALEQGLALVDAVMKEARLDSSDLDRIAVGVGPGSFTGARIAISYAKSLALGWSLPIVPVSSFDILETAAHIEEPHVLCVVRGHREIVSVRLKYDGKELRVSGPLSGVMERISPHVHEGLVLTGDATEDVRAALGERARHVRAIPAVIQPPALALAYAAVRREVARSTHEVRADYGELPPVKAP